MDLGWWDNHHLYAGGLYNRPNLSLLDPDYVAKWFESIEEEEGCEGDKYELFELEASAFYSIVDGICYGRLLLRTAKALDYSNNQSPWSHAETKALISIRKKIEYLFECRNNELLWHHICLQMREKGFDRSSGMCENKWMTMLQEYEKAKPPDMDEHDMMNFYNAIGNTLGCSWSREAYWCICFLLFIPNIGQFQQCDGLKYETIMQSPIEFYTLLEGDDYPTDQGPWSRRKEKAYLFESRTNTKVLWKDISKKLRLKGFNRSSSMCEDKWNTMFEDYNALTSLRESVKINNQLLWEKSQP